MIRDTNKITTSFNIRDRNFKSYIISHNAKMSEYQNNIEIITESQSMSQQAEDFSNFNSRALTWKFHWDGVVPGFIPLICIPA